MNNKKTVLILAVLFVISVLITFFPDKKGINLENSNRNITVTFLNVGQGDSTFIEFPSGKCMLIDASISGEGEKICNHIAQKGYKKIDYIVATHPHNDHIGGMDDIVQYFEIGTVYMPDAVSSTKTYTNLLKSLKKKNTAVKKARSGVSFTEGEVKVDFLSPISNEYDDLNNYSAVVKVTFNEKSFLFMGDAEKLVEQELIKSDADLKADVLKVGHHGSSSSTSKDFLGEVNPDFAVISCGKDNDYGHPHKETLDLLKKKKVKICRTDKDDDIVIVSNGVEVELL